MDKSPLITVAMTTYNHEKYIHEAVQSILNQTFTDFELIIVNDGSTDNTEEIIKKINDNRIIYIAQDNQGPSAAVNRVIKLARGKYIALMTSDDVSYPNRLERQLNEFNKRNVSGIMFSEADFIDEEGNYVDQNDSFVSFSEMKKDYSQAELLSAFYHKGNFINSISGFCRKELFDSVGLYDIRLLQMQDFDMWIRVSLAGLKIEFLHEKLVKYRIRNNNQNLSAPREDSYIRSGFEFKKIFKQFATIKDKELFISIFPELNINKEKFSIDDIPYFLLKTAYGSENKYLKEFAAELFFDKYNEDYAQYLKSKYGFTIKDFYFATAYFYKAPLCYLYVDMGTGYNEQGRIEGKIENNSGDIVSSSFSLSHHPGVREVRFDPLEGKFCKCKIIGVETDGLFQGVRLRNSCSRKDDWDLFLTIDPSYVFKGDFSGATYIKIKYEIIILSDGEIYQAINRLNSN